MATTEITSHSLTQLVSDSNKMLWILDRASCNRQHGVSEKLKTHWNHFSSTVPSIATHFSHQLLHVFCYLFLYSQFDDEILGPTTMANKVTSCFYYQQNARTVYLAWWLDYQLRNLQSDSWQGHKISLFSKTSRWALQSIRLPLQWITGPFPRGTKARCVADQLCSSSAKVQNERNLHSPFMASRNNVTTVRSSWWLPLPRAGR